MLRDRRKKDSYWCCLTVTYGTLGILLLYGALWQLQYENDGTALGKSYCLPESCEMIPSTFTVDESSIFCDLTEKDAVAFDRNDRMGYKSCKEDLLCIREEQYDQASSSMSKSWLVAHSLVMPSSPYI